MSKRTRRQFLEESMFAAAAAVAAHSPGQLLAAVEAGTRASADRRWNVAVVGARGRGKTHLRAFSSRSDTQVTYVCDVDRQVGRRRIQELAKRGHRRLPRLVADLRIALDDPRVDLVTIATPSHWSALAATWAIQSGKDVYVESPVSHTIEEGRHLVETARQHRRICQAGFQARSNPGMRDAMEFLRQGHLGKVSRARSFCHKQRRWTTPARSATVPRDVDLELWCGPRPYDRTGEFAGHPDWRWRWSYGCGDLGNLAAHHVDVARWGLGQQQLCQHAFSFGGRFGVPARHETPNWQVIGLEFGDQMLTHELLVLPTRGRPSGRAGVLFECEHGFVVMTTFHSGAAFDRKGNKLSEFSGQGNHFDNFIRAVNSRRLTDLHAEIEEGHLSSALCHLGNLSYRLGTTYRGKTARMQMDDLCQAARHLNEQRDQSFAVLANEHFDMDQQPICVGPRLQVDPIGETCIGPPRSERLLQTRGRPPFTPHARSSSARQRPG